MLRNGTKRENINIPNSNTESNINKLNGSKYSSNDNNLSRSVKDSKHITHSATSDRKRAPFAMPLKNPYWDENHLWKDANLIYSYKDPEDCLGPPVSKNDKTIRFNSRFESGNLMYAYQLNPDVYHCILEYDHSTSSQCQWFYFQMSNIKAISNSNHKITFYISGFNKASGVFSTGSKVFMYSEKLAKDKNIGWFRTGTNYAYGTISSKSDENRINESRILDMESDNDGYRKKKSKNRTHKLRRSTLSFQITFPYDDDVVYLCYAQPYTYTDLNLNITNWIRSAPSLITKSILCKTNGGKDCPLLTITAPNSPAAANKKCIFVTARIHPGESNGSIVLHGLIDYLLSKTPLTKYLLDHFVFKIVPMVNIDGVIEGYYRVGLEGEDLNRVWNQPDPRKHPVVYQTKNLMHELHTKMGIVAYIDFHGHSREHGTFAYGCPWEENENLPTNMINREKVLPKIISTLSDAFTFEKCIFSIPQKRKDASRCIVRREMGVVNSFTIESSFGGIPNGLWGNSLYNEFVWKEIGAKIGESLFHLFSEPSSQTLKTAENQIASEFPVIKPSASQCETPKIIERKPEVKKKVSRKGEKEANKIVIAIDTQDGIKVIGTEANEQNNQASNTLNRPNSATPSNLKQNNNNNGTVIQKVEPNQTIESIYTLKITDLSSYSSSSASSLSISSARVRRNPRIKMNKKANLNSTMNNPEPKQQARISNSNSTPNVNQNSQSALSQRSNASISRLNEQESSSSDTNTNLDPPNQIPISNTNIKRINSSSSMPKVTDIPNTNLNSSSLAKTSPIRHVINSKLNTNNEDSILVQNKNTIDVKNPIQPPKDTQKVDLIENSKSAQKNNNRTSKPNMLLNNASSYSESSQSANSKNNNEVVTNKIIKPNMASNPNSARNANNASVSKPNAKLISKPNMNTSTKVSIILNHNSTAAPAVNAQQQQQQQPVEPAVNPSPKPPTNTVNHVHRPNPSQNQNAAASSVQKPTPPPQSQKTNAASKQAGAANQTLASGANARPAPASNAAPKPPSTAAPSAKVGQAQAQRLNPAAAKQVPRPPSDATAAGTKANQAPGSSAKQAPSAPSSETAAIQSQKQNQASKETAKKAPQSNAPQGQKQSQVQKEPTKQATQSNAPSSQTQKPNPNAAASKQTPQPSVKQSQNANAASSQRPAQAAGQTKQQVSVQNAKQTQQPNAVQKQTDAAQTSKQTQQADSAPTQTAAPKQNPNSNAAPKQTAATSNAKQNQQQQNPAPKQPNTVQVTKQNPQPNAPQKQPNPTQTTKQNSQPTAAQKQTTSASTAKQNPQPTAATKQATQPPTASQNPSQKVTETPKMNQQPPAPKADANSPSMANPSQPAPTAANQNAAACKNDAQKASQNANQKPKPTPKASANQQPVKTENRKPIQSTVSAAPSSSAAKPISPSKAIHSPVSSKDDSQKTDRPNSNSIPNPRMNHLTNMQQTQNPAPAAYDFDDLSSNSYLSTQSDSNFFNFFNEELTNIPDTYLLNDSTATFNSSSAYSSPIKSAKTPPYEKTQQKAQAVQLQQKQKISQNSKSPKYK